MYWPSKNNGLIIMIEIFMFIFMSDTSIPLLLDYDRRINGHEKTII